MTGKSVLTLLVAVVVGSVQVDWNGDTMKLRVGQQRVFAAEDDARNGARDTALVDRPKEAQRDAAGETSEQSFSGVVLASISTVVSTGEKWVSAVTLASNAGDAMLPVEMDQNGKELGMRFHRKSVTVKGKIIQENNGLSKLVVTGMPEANGVDRREEEAGQQNTRKFSQRNDDVRAKARAE